METIIVICLLIVIVLLLQDKIVIQSRNGQKVVQEKQKSKLPDIMGKSKPVKRQLMPKSAKKSQKREQQQKVDNFGNEIKAQQDDIEIAQELIKNMPDLDEEEEEWNRYGLSGDDDGFALGVTFEELSSVGMLLQKDKLEASQKETAVAIVQKIQGTELFSLLENSIEGATIKIAMLLDRSLSKTESFPSNLGKNDLADFDIGEFV